MRHIQEWEQLDYKLLLAEPDVDLFPDMAPPTGPPEKRICRARTEGLQEPWQQQGGSQDFPAVVGHLRWSTGALNDQNCPNLGSLPSDGAPFQISDLINGQTSQEFTVASMLQQRSLPRFVADTLQAAVLHQLQAAWGDSQGTSETVLSSGELGSLPPLGGAGLVGHVESLQSRLDTRLASILDRQGSTGADMHAAWHTSDNEARSLQLKGIPMPGPGQAGNQSTMGDDPLLHCLQSLQPTVPPAQWSHQQTALPLCSELPSGSMAVDAQLEALMESVPEADLPEIPPDDNGLLDDVLASHQLKSTSWERPWSRLGQPCPQVEALAEQEFLSALFSSELLPYKSTSFESGYLSGVNSGSNDDLLQCGQSDIRPGLRLDASRSDYSSEPSPSPVGQSSQDFSCASPLEDEDAPETDVSDLIIAAAIDMGKLVVTDLGTDPRCGAGREMQGHSAALTHLNGVVTDEKQLQGILSFPGRTEKSSRQSQAASSCQRGQDVPASRLPPSHVPGSGGPLSGSVPEANWEIIQRLLATSAPQLRPEGCCMDADPCRGSGATSKAPVNDCGLRMERSEYVLSQGLMALAQAMAMEDEAHASTLLRYLKEDADPAGSVMQRIVFYFLDALSHRMLGTGHEFYAKPRLVTPKILTYVREVTQYCASLPALRLWVYGMNGAIFDAVRGERRVHIVDLALWTNQWGPLLRCLAGQPGGPPHVRFTAVPLSRGELPTTGFSVTHADLKKELEAKAAELNLPLTFEVVHSPLGNLRREMLRLDKGEALAVCCGGRLSFIPDSTVVRSSPRDATLKMLLECKPKVVTMCDFDADFNSPFFMVRFKEALNLYWAIFDMQESAAPRDSVGRQAFENYLSRRLTNIIACEGTQRTARSETLQKWRIRMNQLGYVSRPILTEVGHRTFLPLKERLRPPLEKKVVKGAWQCTYGSLPINWVSAWQPFIDPTAE